MTNRNKLIKILKKEFPGMQCRLGEEFSYQYMHAIWTGEDAPSIDGNAMFNYHGASIDPRETVWVMGVHRKLRDILDEHGWYAEFHDPGTVFIIQG